MNTQGSIEFRVSGLPAPAGSKRSFPVRRKDGRIGVAVTDTSARLKPWQAAVQIAAQQALPAGIGPDVPIILRMDFYLPRPKQHLGRKGLRQSAPRYPVIRPDVGKLARAVEDALAGIAYQDDAQIVEVTATKSYTLQSPGVAVAVTALTPGDTDARRDGVSVRDAQIGQPVPAGRDISCRGKHEQVLNREGQVKNATGRRRTVLLSGRPGRGRMAAPGIPGEVHAGRQP